MTKLNEASKYALNSPIVFIELSLTALCLAFAVKNILVLFSCSENCLFSLAALLFWFVISIICFRAANKNYKKRFNYFKQKSEEFEF